MVETVALRIGGRTHRIRNVRHERCPDCDERIFDLETSRRFDTEILGSRRRAAA